MATLQQSTVNGFRFGRTAGNQNLTAAFGRYAGNSTNNYHTAVGYRSSLSNTSYSAFGGARAGEYNSNVSNVGVGFCAFRGSGGRYQSVAVGQRAQSSSTGGRHNVALGSFAFDSGTGNVQSIAIGVNAGRSSNADNATFAGVDAGCSVSATENTFFGFRSGRAHTTGYGTMGIGWCSAYSANAIRAITIGANIAATGTWHIAWGNSANNVCNCVWGGWSYFSDARDKTDIEPLTCDTGLKFIKKLRPVSFNFDNRENYVRECNFPYGQKDGTLAVDKKEYGFLAQEVKQALEELNITDFSALKYNESQDAYRLTYADFLSPLTKAIQELDEKTQALKLKVGI